MRVLAVDNVFFNQAENDLVLQANMDPRGSTYRYHCRSFCFWFDIPMQLPNCANHQNLTIPCLDV